MKSKTVRELGGELFHEIVLEEHNLDPILYGVDHKVTSIILGLVMGTLAR